MRIGGIGIATVNVRGWDGSAWQNVKVAAPLSDGATPDRLLHVDSYLHGYNGTTWDCLRTDNNKHLIVNIGGRSYLSHGQVSVSATATLIKAANTNRKALTIKNIGANDVDLGWSNVTFGTGFRLAAGEALSDIRTTAAIYGICNTGLTSTVCYWEE